MTAKEGIISLEYVYRIKSVEEIKLLAKNII